MVSPRTVISRMRPALISSANCWMLSGDCVERAVPKFMKTAIPITMMSNQNNPLRKNLEFILPRTTFDLVSFLGKEV